MFIDFRKRGRERERETSMRNRNTYSLFPVHSWTEDQTQNLKWQHFGAQDDTPTNLATQLGLHKENL